MSSARLDRECNTFTRYLIGVRPDPYVSAKYAEAHRKLGATLTSASRFERVHVGVARRHPFLTHSADAWGRHFAPRGLLRKKLVLLLAILESAPATFERVERVAGRSRAALLAAMAVRGVLSILHLILGTLLFVPLRLVYGAGRSGDTE